MQPIRTRLAVMLMLPLVNLAGASWTVRPPLLLPGAAGTFDETAVKDPSIVQYEGRWHVFYTARGQNRYSIGYASARSLDQLAAAPHVELKQLRGRVDYHAAAPQVFFFAPQRKWYLVFQTLDSNYQPVFSTTETVERPGSWTAPAPLVEKQDRAKWIDFWVICDSDTAYLFFTRDQKDVVVMTTPKAQFPKGFHGMSSAFHPLHEAVHIYRAQGKPHEWLMLFEDTDGPRRRFGLARSESLAGPWNLVTRDFATGAQLRYPPGAERWTDQVSHGELLRTGYDEFMEVDAAKPQFLIQGLTVGQHRDDYPSLPWRLGLIRREE